MYDSIGVEAVQGPGDVKGKAQSEREMKQLRADARQIFTQRHPWEQLCYYYHQRIFAGSNKLPKIVNKFRECTTTLDSYYQLLNNTHAHTHTHTLTRLSCLTRDIIFTSRMKRLSREHFSSGLTPRWTTLIATIRLPYLRATNPFIHSFFYERERHTHKKTDLPW